LLPSGVIAADPPRAKPSDFNGDGYTDLAIGVPREGAVNVLYGSSTGLTAAGDQYWSLTSPGIPGTTDDDPDFGMALATGDFDLDGFADLAVSAPLDDPTFGGVGGSVTIIYGSSHGLSAVGAQRWTEENLPGALGNGGNLGFALAAGDFDGDDDADLAIGIEWWNPGSEESGAGVVVVLFGGAAGLVATDAQRFSQATDGVPGDPHEDEGFGRALRAGDFSGDGIDDLAVGVPGDTVSVERGGGVNILYGSVDGLAAAGSQLFTQDTPGIGGSPDRFGLFGWALAVGDFDRDGIADLAIGAPMDQIDGHPRGSVDVIYGSESGLSVTGSTYWDQGVPGVPGSNEAEDRFGGALAAGDFDSDGADDLAVGAPGEQVGKIVRAGAVTLLYGSSTGIGSTGSATFTQNSSGVPGACETDDQFGFALAAGDFGRSGRDDLAIGAFHEDIGRVRSTGVVDVLYGRLTGLSGTAAQSWSQASPGVKGTIKRSDHFGWALTP
jgi:hypothetical protein